MYSTDTTPLKTGPLLAEAESLARLGRHDKALDVLERIRRVAGAEHSEHWLGLVCVATARNKLHVHDDRGAVEYLALISPELRAANPKIDAECHMIAGILSRRKAHRTWKSGHGETALLEVRQAVDAFTLAQHSAQMALEDRLLNNAILNRLYAIGLNYAIQAQPQERYAALLVDAIVAEVASRDSTPPCVRDDLSGLTIVADLACGGGIGLRAVPTLSNEASFQIAVRKFVHDSSASWAELILGYVRDMSSCKTDVQARALLLGCKMLHAGGHTVDEVLLTEYAARLRIHYLDLESAAYNVLLRQRIVDALARFPQAIACKVMHPRFLR